MKKRYVTPGVHGTIPAWLQNMMWFLWEAMEVSVKDDFQSFCLSSEGGMQKIEHSQNQPLYHKVIMIPSEGETICKKIIILETSDSLVMMLDNEF